MPGLDLQHMNLRETHQSTTSTNTDFKATEIRKDLPRGKYVQGYGKNKEEGLFIKLPWHRDKR